MPNESRTEQAPPEIIQKLAMLEEHKQHVATKKDIEELKGIINLNKVDLKRVIESSIKDSEIRTLKSFLRNWTVGAGLVVPATTALIVFLLHIAFK